MAEEAKSPEQQSVEFNLEELCKNMDRRLDEFPASLSSRLCS